MTIKNSSNLPLKRSKNLLNTPHSIRLVFMISIRILNYFIICCFFMPFFQFCSGCAKEAVPTEETIAIEYSELIDTIYSSEEENDNAISIAPTDTLANKEEANAFFDFIRPLLYTDNCALSGAGIIYAFAAYIIDQKIPVAHPLLLFTITSTIFLILMSIKIHAKKTAKAKVYSSLLSISNLLLFISAIFFLDQFTDIKWGFYLFLFSSLLITFLLRKKFQSPS